MCYIYTTEYYSAIKKNETWPLATMWRQLEMIMLSEVRKRKTDIMISLIYLIDCDTNELTYETETDSQT